MQRRALLLSTAIGGQSTGIETPSERHQQFKRGLATVLDLVGGIGFDDVFICDNTVANFSDIAPDIAELVDRIQTNRQFFFCENDLGALNKGAGVIAQIDRVLPIIQGNYERIIFFEPRQRIREPQIFLKVLESDTNIFKVQRLLTLRRGIVPWIYREVHTGFFSLSTSEMCSFLDSHRPADLVKKGISLERAMFLHLASRKFSFEAIPQLGISRIVGLSEANL